MEVLVTSFPHTEEIGKKVARALKAQYTKLEVGQFPDSEYHLNLKKNPSNKTVVIINSMSGEPNQGLIETLLAGGIARDYGAKKVILVATYLPYMRQDTHFKEYDSFSSRYILKLFKNFDSVIALDPHLHRIKQLKQLLKNAHSITVNSLVADYIKKRFKNNFTIVGPDEESAQWSQTIATMLGKKVVILKKTRYSSEHVSVAEQKLGENVLIIDDIISTGHTILETIKMAKKQKAKKIVCIGIHGVLVLGAAEKILKDAELITSNTIPNKYAHIDVSPAIVESLRKFI